MIRHIIHSSGRFRRTIFLQIGTLGIRETAVVDVTQAAPDSMAWMTYEESASAGITVQLADPPKTSAEVAPEGGAVDAGDNLVILRPADTFGYDLMGMPLTRIFLGYCQRAGVSGQLCQEFAYNKKHSACVLKPSGESVFRNPQADAGYWTLLASRLRLSKMTILEGTDISGGDDADLKDV